MNSGDEMKYSFEDYESLPDVPPAVFHIIRSQDGKFVDGHNRLRIDYDQMAERLSLMQSSITSHDTQLANVAKRTTDIAQLRFTPQMVAGLIVFAVATIGGQYAANAGLREQVAATNSALAVVNTKMDALKQHNEDATKLLEERSATLADAIKRVEARSELTDLKVNNLRESVLTGNRR